MFRYVGFNLLFTYWVPKTERSLNLLVNVEIKLTVISDFPKSK